MLETNIHQQVKHSKGLFKKPMIQGALKPWKTSKQDHILCVQQQRKIQHMKREERIAIINARNALINPHETPLNNQKTMRTTSGE